MENQKKFKLENLPFGEAKIKVLKTKQGDYGMHRQTGWDDTPYWIFHSAWIITEQAHGILNWGPYKFRNNSREISDRSELNILETELLVETEEDRRQEAEEMALAKALELERKGFRVELEFGEETQPRNLAKVYKWESNLPSEWIRRRYEKRIYRVNISDLSLELKGGEGK